MFQNLEILDLLINIGINVNSTDEFGEAPLFGAIIADESNNETRFTNLLLEQGANSDVRNKLGWTPLMFAQTTKISQLLIDKGAYLDAKNNLGNTALHIAIENIDLTSGDISQNNFYQKVKLLLQSNSRIDIKNNEGKTVDWNILNSDNEEVRKLAELVTKENFVSEESFEEFCKARDELKKDNVDVNVILECKSIVNMNEIGKTII